MTPLRPFLLIALLLAGCWRDSPFEARPRMPELEPCIPLVRVEWSGGVALVPRPVAIADVWPDERRTVADAAAWDRNGNIVRPRRVCTEMEMVAMLELVSRLAGRSVLR